MIKAVIDLGTNTFNLLIADVRSSDFSVLHTEKEGVSLGMGGINQQFIAPEAQRRALATLYHFHAVCKVYGVQQIIALGTSALRDATNSSQFVREVAQKLNIHIDIISGEDEATLIYKGVQWSYPFQSPAVIMDIGGGSTEFVFANKNGITDLVSLNIGVSRIFQLFQFNDPLSPENIATIEQWLEKESNGFFRGKKETTLVGASGSFETFYEFIHAAPFPEKIHAIEIPLSKLNAGINAVIASTQSERDTNQWIIPIRKKMAPITAVKTRWVIQQLAIEKIFISPCSLKEGALSD
jgi:exopolyphosphatase/guanosine-5'-triphosphate,3'-diphosphate pyrophosphatase